ncbi:MAG: Uma2 family endonuclease [Thermostichus sp. BF3_bins_97]
MKLGSGQRPKGSHNNILTRTEAPKIQGELPWGCEEGRLSDVLWEEDGIPPIFALEVGSRTYGGEYERKKTDYAKLGILYYAIYVPSRRYRHNRPSLEIYRLVNGIYELQTGE